MKYNTFSEVPSTSVVGAQKDLGDKLLNGTILFEEFTAFLKMSRVKRHKIFGFSSILDFTIGDVFQHKNQTLTLMYFSDKFKKRFFKPNKEKVITIPNSMSTLEEYVLPKNMDNDTIQKNTASIPLDTDTFWIVLYCLIIEPKLGKELLSYELRKDKVYIMQVQVGTIVHAFVVRWYRDKWDLDASSFDDGYDWLEGYVFLSL